MKHVENRQKPAGRRGGRWRRIARPVAERLTAAVGTVRAVRTDRREVVLTYDDGPALPGTPAVLEALARHRATATFFVLTPRARRHRGLLDDLLAAGHEVALHGRDHRRLTGRPFSAVVDELRAAREELEDLTGCPVRWYRPPYGAQSPATYAATRAAGLVPVAWGPTAYDWLAEPERALADRALAGVHPGAVVLAHDAWPGPDVGVDDGEEPPVDRGLLAELLLAGLAERGLAARSLSGLLDAGGRPHRWAWFRR